MTRSHLANSITRAAVLFTVTAAAVIAVSAAPASAVVCPPSSGPSRDINTYVLFGISDLDFKGGSAPTTGNVLGGDVGVQKTGGTIHVGANHDFTTSDCFAVAADNAELGAGTDVYDVYANTSSVNAAATIRGSGPAAYTLPTVNNLPQQPTVTADAFNPVTVNDNDTRNLDPGNYGLLDLHKGGTLNLGNGVYNFTEFSTSSVSFTINTLPGTDVRVAGAGNFGDNGVIHGSDLAKFFFAGSGGGTIVQFGKQTEFHGQLYVPNGLLKLGNSTDLTGRFWADDIGSDEGVNITYSAPGTPAINTTASGTVVLGGKIHDTAQLTGGNNPTGTITFDLYGPDDADCTGATLASDQVPVAGAGSYDSPEFTTTAVGTYRWIATYSGDANNSPAGGQCNDDGEAVVVTAPPCVPTAGQDANCQPIPPVTPPAPKPVTPQTVDSAKVSGVKSGCGTTSNVKVSGSNIKKVTYKIDGRTVKTVTKSPYSYKLKTKSYKVGVHKLKVTTTFKSGKTKTQTLTFQHCKQVQPHFTG